MWRGIYRASLERHVKYCVDNNISGPAEYDSRKKDPIYYACYKGCKCLDTEMQKLGRWKQNGIRKKLSVQEHVDFCVKNKIDSPSAYKKAAKPITLFTQAIHIPELSQEMRKLSLWNDVCPDKTSLKEHIDFCVKNKISSPENYRKFSPKPKNLYHVAQDDLLREMRSAGRWKECRQVDKVSLEEHVNFCVTNNIRSHREYNRQKKPENLFAQPHNCVGLVTAMKNRGLWKTIAESKRQTKS